MAKTQAFGCARNPLVSDVPLPLITPAQCREARRLLGLSRERLAAIAGISSVTVARFEDEKRLSRPISVSTIRAALKAVGVEFIAENGGRAGMRLRKG